VVKDVADLLGEDDGQDGSQDDGQDGSHDGGDAR
jgi:hypothetical protein